MFELAGRSQFVMPKLAPKKAAQQSQKLKKAKPSGRIVYGSGLKMRKPRKPNWDVSYWLGGKSTQ